MSAYNRTFRLECEASRRGRLIDQRTDQMPAVIRGESAEFEIALFQNGVMVQKDNITSIAVMLVDFAAVVLVEWTLAGDNLNGSVTPGQWRRGTSHLASFVLNNSQTLALEAGTYSILVRAALHSVPPGTSGVVFFAEGTFDLVETPEGGLPSSPPTPGPPTAYTQAESDALFAVKSTEADLNSAEVAISVLQSTTAIGGAVVDQKFVKGALAQSFTVAEKLQARTNIGAQLSDTVQLAAIAAAGTFTPTPATHNVFDVTILGTGTITFADAVSSADWLMGRTYRINIRQPAAGNARVTWNATYSLPTYVAIDPQPSAVTRLLLHYDGSVKRITEAEPMTLPHPDIDWKPATRMTVSSAGGGGWTSWSDCVGGLNMGLAGGLATIAKLNSRQAVSFTGANQFSFQSGRDLWSGGFPDVNGGAAIAVVFHSTSSGSPQFLVCDPFTGLEVAYNSASGLYIAGIGAASGNRCALSFAGVGASGTRIFIGAIRESGGGGLALDNDGAIAYLSTAAMATPSTGTSYMGSAGGSGYWNGYVARVMIFSSTIKWAQMVALRRHLSQWIGI